MNVFIIGALIVVGLIAIIIELFLPTAGIIGIVGGGCIVAGISLTYRYFGAFYGTIVLLATLTATPLFVMLTLKIFPRTIFGKKIILHNSFTSKEGYVSHTASAYSGLLNQTCVAATPLRPSGMVYLGAEKYSVVTGGEFIEKGKTVTIIEVEGSKIVVREATDN